MQEDFADSNGGLQGGFAPALHPGVPSGGRLNKVTVYAQAKLLCPFCPGEAPGSNVAVLNAGARSCQ